MRIRLESVGCRLNAGEMEAVARDLAAAGHVLVGAGSAAELCIVNSCTVTTEADRSSRQLIHGLRRDLPDAALVVTGCYAEMSPDQVRALGVDLVIANRDKDRLVEALAEAGICPPACHPLGAIEGAPPCRGPSTRTRAVVKVQDGCDLHCAYCVVTVARGAARSRLPADVESEVQRLVTAGSREVVLSGVHLGSYGHDHGQRSGLEHLVRRLLEKTTVERLRLSSIEPWDLDPSFFDLFADPRLLPHLHLPLQSGCDETLARMARRTRCDEYAALLVEARSRVPDLAISTDVMVGLPGETDAEFDRSLATVAAMGFARLHVFRYSRRSGTPAAAMPDQVPGHVARARSRRMIEVGRSMQRAFDSRFAGRTMPVLWETPGPTSDGCREWSGLTPNSIRVITRAPAGVDLSNTITMAHLENTRPAGLRGVLAPATPERQHPADTG